MVLKKLATNFTLIFTSVYLPLFVLSLFIEFAPERESWLIEQRRALNDKNLIIEAINNNQKPTFYPQLVRKYFFDSEYYPIGSLPETNSYLCNEGYGMINYNSDIIGLRNKPEVWKRVSKKNNIFLIGDSYVHGCCVEDHQTISSQFAEISSDNIVNLGMGGAGPHEYIAAIKTVVKPILSETKKLQQ